jgi:opacity protein-like surface antigen
MTIKKTLIATAVISALASSQAFADDTTLKGYIEAQLGYSNLSKVNTNTYSGTADGVTATNLMGKLNYDSSATFGAEYGLNDVIVDNLRVGISFSTMKFDLKNAVISGSLTDGVTTYTGPVTLSAADFASVGVSLDNRVYLYMANAYYDFKNKSPFTPFVGFGLGVADIKNADGNEFAYSLHAGAKYNINKDVYIGAKATYTNISGPTDQLGIKFNNIDAYSANLALGFEI